MGDQSWRKSQNKIAELLLERVEKWESPAAIKDRESGLSHVARVHLEKKTKSAISQAKKRHEDEAKASILNVVN